MFSSPFGLQASDGDPLHRAVSGSARDRSGCASRRFSILWFQSLKQTAIGKRKKGSVPERQRENAKITLPLRPDPVCGSSQGIAGQVVFAPFFKDLFGSRFRSED